LEREMIEYQQDRFGPQGDLVLQKRRLIQPIQDQVFNEVQKIGANKKYDFIFDKSLLHAFLTCEIIAKPHLFAAS